MRNVLGMPTYYTRQPKIGGHSSGKKLTKDQINMMLQRSSERSKKRMKVINKHMKGTNNA